MIRGNFDSNKYSNVTWLCIIIIQCSNSRDSSYQNEVKTKKYVIFILQMYVFIILEMTFFTKVTDYAEYLFTGIIFGFIQIMPILNPCYFIKKVSYPNHTRYQWYLIEFNLITCKGLWQIQISQYSLIIGAYILFNCFFK